MRPKEYQTPQALINVLGPKQRGKEGNKRNKIFPYGFKLTVDKRVKEYWSLQVRVIERERLSVPKSYI
jgi:hypothetical protein